VGRKGFGLGRRRGRGLDEGCGFVVAGWVKDALMLFFSG
jgi:hypothetical protein